MRKPTLKQRTFCDEYLIDMNGKQAAIRAGYSAKSAEVQASQLLSKPNVQAWLRKRLKDREKRTEITQDRVLLELARVAFGNTADLAQWQDDGSVIVTPSEDLTEDQSAMVAEVSTSATGVKIKAHDKLRALELIGRHLAMFTDNKDVRHQLLDEDGKPVALKARVSFVFPEDKQ